MVLNFSRFSWGIGFSILVVLVVGGGICLANNFFGGICRIIGK